MQKIRDASSNDFSDLATTGSGYSHSARYIIHEMLHILKNNLTHRNEVGSGELSWKTISPV